MPLILNGSTGISASGGSAVIADGAIGTNQLAASAVTAAKVAAGVAVANIGAGGISVNELSTQATPIGVGQSWTNQTGNRALGTTYTNSTGKSIQVVVSLNQASLGIGHQVYVGGISFNAFQINSGAGGITSNSSFIVPNGQTYSIAAQVGESIGHWAELR